MKKSIITTLSIGLLAFAVIFIVNIAIDPGFGSMSRDGGAFAYCGQRISEGALLYRDCWDNKPPGIYYLDAAIITIAGASQWSIWLFQSIWLSFTVAAFYTIISKVWGNRSTILNTAFFLLTLLYPVYFSGGNLTETYALLPITLTLGAYFGYLQTHKPIYLVGIGFFTALSFLFKPTYISLGIAVSLIVMYLLVKKGEFRKLPLDLGLILGSFFFPLLFVAGYWASKNDLGDLLYAVFIHNRLYIETGFSFNSLIVTLRILILEQPLSTMVALALISLIVFLVVNGKKLWQAELAGSAESDVESNRLWIMAALAIALILDVVFIILPGTNFRHYYLIPILTMGASSAYFFFLLLQAGSLREKSRPFSMFIIVAALVLMLPWAVEIAGKELPTLANWRALFSNPNITYNQPDDIENFILENSTPEQSILIWDYDPTIYFHVNRRSPTRFIFLRHLYTPIPGAPNGFSEFMQELQQDPPELIITSKTAQQGLPYLGLSEDEICSACSADIRQGVIEFKRYVEQYYQPYTDIQAWAVYKRIP